MKAIRLEAKTAQEILGGRSTWLISSIPFDSEGPMAIVQACSDLILGQIIVSGGGKRVSEDLLLQNQHLLCQSEQDNLRAGKYTNGDYYVIVFRSPVRYFSAVRYHDVKSEIPMLDAA